MARRPNVLLILSDQHSPHIAGFAGNTIVRTAALDGLATSGTCFEAAYCQSPLCVPSRTSLLASKWAYRCSAWDNSSVLFPEHVTLPGWLAAHGYTTATVGKMHFRGREQMHGFQYRPYGDLIESRFPGHQPDPPETSDGRWNKHSVGRFPFAGATAIPESLLIDQVVTAESLSWLLEFADRNPEKPWFFCASYPRPHFPLTAPGRYVRRYLESELQMPAPPPGYPDALHSHDRFIVDDFNLLQFPAAEQRRALAAYYASVNYLDDCIAALLEGLRRAGRLGDTYVVYTTDHGDLAGEHGLWWKRTYYDASAGVPLIVVGPGIPAGVRVPAPVELVDLFPTICEWVGVPTPEGLDGESLAPFLAGRPGERRKDLARSELIGERPQVRFRMIRDRRWKYVDFPAAPPRLFDLENDRDEEHDLWPNAPAETPVERLRAALEAGGTWANLEQKRQADRERAGVHVCVSHGSAQYRLAGGRLMEADALLYDPRRDLATGS